jgi:hypothetical protein
MKHRRGQLDSDSDNDEEDTGEQENVLPQEDPEIGGRVCYNKRGAVVINSLTYDDFRNRLVEHFDIMFRNQRVQWPVRK